MLNYLKKINPAWKNIDFKNLNYISIVKGWYYKLIAKKLNLIPYDQLQQSIIRKSHCQGCPLNNNNWCDSSREALDINGKLVNGCGCELDAKTLTSNQECPRLLWTEMLNQKDWNDYIIKINSYYVDNNKPEIYEPTAEDYQIINSLLYGTATT